MTTTSLTNTSSPTATTSTNANGTQMASSSGQLTANDFINMMVTQLQNQDPLNPTSSSDLLNQMSQIGQLQSSTQLSSSLQTMTLQSNIASASNMIGKQIDGLDANGAPLSGQVTAVHVANNQVSLDLDNGKTVDLQNITDVAPAAATATTAAGAATGATTPSSPTVPTP
jgi:flagellar basal-body rod modification protein FlgD